jgi:hypothetical protein
MPLTLVYDPRGKHSCRDHPADDRYQQGGERREGKAFLIGARRGEVQDDRESRQPDPEEERGQML